MFLLKFCDYETIISLIIPFVNTKFVILRLFAILRLSLLTLRSFNCTISSKKGGEIHNERPNQEN